MSDILIPQVDERFLPKVFFAEFPDEKIIEDAEFELRQKAQLDPNQCYGFFPDNHAPGIDHNLPACDYFAQAHPLLPYDDHLFYFSWLRLSLVRHHPINDTFHLDGNSRSGLTAETNGQSQLPGFRAILNLGTSARTLCYSTQHPDSALTETTEAGHTTCFPLDETVYRFDIAPRRANLVTGVIFCATHVMHTGDSPAEEHFLLSYGRDEIES